MATTPLDDPRDRAFERMYQRYAQDVYRYALAVLRNPADAEDVTQTTFMNAYRAFKDGTQIEKPQNWLIKIAHNACRTRFIRAQRRPQEVPLEDSIERIAVPESERPNVRSILRALGQLPFNQRSALVMRELEGRSYEEIADTLGVSVSAVETLIFRARRSLRLKASSLRALTFVQLPSTLRSFWESGAGEAVTTGGALVGGGAAFKAVAVLVAGLVAGGAGYKAVSAGTLAHSSPGKVEPHAAPTSAVLAASYSVQEREQPGRAVQARVKAPAVTGAPGKAAKPAPDEPQKGSAATQRGGSSTAGASSPSAAAVGSSGGAASPPSVPALPPAPTVPAVTAPSLPPTPTVPTPTVPAPTLPSPPTIPDPPTVPVPTLPQPPPPPALP
jgi:RNA polymerase sigma factor (sigma-70 family)